MIGWREVRLDEVADLTVGHVGTMATEYVSDGVPFLRSQNIRPLRLDLDGVKFISDDFHRRLKKSALREGDVAIVRTGKPGAAVAMPPGLPEMNCSDLVIARPTHALDSRWLAYFINAVAGQFVSSRLVGAVQQHFNVGAAREMRLHLPPLREQQAIVGVLGTLDDKIQSNGRLSETCRALVRLELDARENAWPEIAVSTLARFINGGAYTKGASGTGRMVIRIAELSNGAGGSTVYNDITVPDDRVARPGDLLMAWSGSLGIHVWLGDEAVVNQHIFKVIPEGVPPWLVFDRLERVMPSFRQIASDKATTMGHIKRHHLDDALVRAPVGPALKEFDALLSPHWLRALTADLESVTLAELRDALLPELLSGRLRVPVAEGLVGAAM